MSLLTSLHAQLKQGDIPFVDFMQQALYAPEFGYYSSGLQKLGRGGDFITAPELTPLFGQTLALQSKEILAQLDKPCLFEFGAGTGRLCVDLLTTLERLNSLPETYYILELSDNLRQRQQEFIQQKIPHLTHKVQWLDRWPSTPFNGVILANEVLDAMPVHRFLQAEEGLLESFVSLNANKELVEVFKLCKNKNLIDHLHNRLPTNLIPYLSEANLFINGWIKQCFEILIQGVVILIDYGFPQHEYYHEDRNSGTLMCHYQHKAHADPFLNIGEQDITAHVNFTHVAEAAVEAGFHVAGYSNQASFLLANGLLSLVEQIESERERFRAQQAVKQLLLPSEMGELFKVIALTKNLDLDLQGFQLQDKRASL